MIPGITDSYMRRCYEKRRRRRRQPRSMDTANENLQLCFCHKEKQDAAMQKRKNSLMEVANAKLAATKAAEEKAAKQRAAFEQDLRQEVQAQEISAYEEKRAAEKWKERQQRESFVADSIIERGRQDMKTPTLTPSIQNDIFWMA